MSQQPRREDDEKDDLKASDILGLGGLLKGVGALIDLISEMAEKGVETQEQVKEFQGKGPLKDVRGVFGVSVRMGIGERGESREVHLEPFGNVHKTPSGVKVEEVREPMVDVFDEGDELVIVGELPGIEASDIQMEFAGDILQLRAERGTRRYAKELLLPAVVDGERARLSFTNGIVEIRVPKVQKS